VSDVPLKLIADVRRPRRCTGLAQVSEPPSRGGGGGSGGGGQFAARSMRNHGSAESLEPKGAPEAHPCDPDDAIAPLPSPRKSDPSSSPIYYDGSVQVLFEELVKSVSATGYMIHKANWVREVGQLRRPAEMEMVDDDAGDELPGLGADAGNSLAVWLPDRHRAVLY